MKKSIKSVSFRVFFVKDINKLEHDAVAQYKFNRFWAAIWFLAMIPVIEEVIRAILAWRLPALTQYLILLVSLWANFATHFGAMSGALAAMNTSKTVNDISDDIDDIHEAVADPDPLPNTWNLEVSDVN